MDAVSATPAPAAKPAAPKFGERVADILGQVLPHFHLTRKLALDEAKELALKAVVAGASDPLLIAKVKDLAGRATTYTQVIDTLLADPNLSAEVAVWFKAHVAGAQ